MLPDEQKVHELELKVGLLGKDVEQTDRLCEKLSESIAKIQELNVNIMQMITLHEQRHEQHEKVETDLKDDIRDLHDRIDQVERHISARIDALRNDLMNHKQQDRGRIPEMLAEIEKYKWMILGGALALGWLIGHVDLTMLGKLLK
jgi:predicted  nucleic acid-binding Zn-ribbon protein